MVVSYLKFIYSEKATKFCEISTLLLSYVVPVKSKMEISQNFVAFSEYLTFIRFPKAAIEFDDFVKFLSQIDYLQILNEYQAESLNGKIREVEFLLFFPCCA